MQHYHTLSPQQQQQLIPMQLQHQQQQQQLLQQQHQQMPPNARHHQHSVGHPSHTMTINRKMIEQSHYSEDNPPPLPPLRNPQKALETVQAIPSLNDSSVNERDKQIYICSSLKNPNNQNLNNNASSSNSSSTNSQTNNSCSYQNNGNNSYGTMKPTNNTIKNQTTFNSTASTTTKPLASIINTPLPAIPKNSQSLVSKDEIYVKRKLIDQNSKFATLKAIPLPKIEALEIEAQKKKNTQQTKQQNLSTGTANENTMTTITDPLPSPPVTTNVNTMTTTQIQSLPLPLPPPELIEEPLPPPPPPVDEDGQIVYHDDSTNMNVVKSDLKEVIYATKKITNTHTNGASNGNNSVACGNCTANPTNTNNNSDENSFYAVTEL
ncbi:homeobox protein 5-like [Wyeomyia smithii]|uniref:homeobox protein 5-like n=1 Tax=Wyeomyia smithii TaxID=174621 RepID=UPI00246813DF|nr:homeobox protein 5-like [Wyeomyia smithii]